MKKFTNQHTVYIIKNAQKGSETKLVNVYA